MSPYFHKTQDLLGARVFEAHCCLETRCGNEDNQLASEFDQPRTTSMISCVQFVDPLHVS